MSDFKSVKVASVDVKTGGGENGKREWTKYSLVDGNGEKASTFDTKIGKFLQDHVGKQIDITTEQDGKFTNLLSAVEHVEAAKTNGGGNGYARDPETEMRIAREACLKAAVEFGKGTTNNSDETLRVAEKFVRWVYSGANPALEAAINGSKAERPALIDPDTAPSPHPSSLMGRAIAAFNKDPKAALAYISSNDLSADLTKWAPQQLADFIGIAVPA